MQMRALLFVAILTSGITDAMEALEKAVATALGLTGAFSLSPHLSGHPAVPDHRGVSGMLSAVASSVYPGRKTPCLYE